MQTISYQEVKQRLLTAIQMSGYAKDSEKSCAAWLVFRSESGDKVVVARKTNYTTFFNPNIPDDKGDVIDFLLHRLNGVAVDTSLTQKGNVERLRQALDRVAGYTPSVDTPATAAKPAAAAASYDVRPFTAAAPFDVAQLLRIRGVSMEVLKQQDVAAELGLLHSGSHVNLFFRWRDERGNSAGGQYKYLNTATGGTAKYFLPGTSRHNSVWSTGMEGKDCLFVCEDPFDAIAYRQLNPDKSFALLATGGAITREQVAIIKSKARLAHMPIVLGNDSDIAGQVSNLKILDEAAKIISVDARQQTAAICCSGGQEKSVTRDELKEIVAERCRQSREAYCLAVPKGKDWNEDLLKRTKAAPSHALRAALSGSPAAPCRVQQQRSATSIHY